MSAQPADSYDGQHGGQHDARQPGPAGWPDASVLEEAFRRALAAYLREAEAGKAPGKDSASKDSASKVQKVSVSMPAYLTDLVRSRTGTGGFSRYVAEATLERFRLDLLADLSAELESEYGPVDDDLIRQAVAEWPDSAPEQAAPSFLTPRESSS